MRLERLELSGFKSFSDRSELAFDEGVTAIVGPNGCGKSNVADALTWVLGEQSAKSLRGEKMEDVIFSGSDARKPTGAAEVRLKLSGVVVPPSLEKEMGYEPAPARRAARPPAPTATASTATPAPMLTRDVEVTRRLFRSGESEYLIDGHQCRLRDIHELLMDTGLGAKAYAIIEQGKIGMILSSRPTDRRQLIEEAAGITKYKARRRAAELKLEAAQQNLTRLDDIVFEVEKQKGALKRQAAKARRYTRLRDEMRRWEKVLFARRYRALGEAIENTRAPAGRRARAAKPSAAARLAEVETALATLRIEQAEADAAAGQVAGLGPRPRAGHQPAPAADRARSPAGGDARDARRRAGSGTPAARGAARARARWRSRRAARPCWTPSASATSRRAACRPRATSTRRAQQTIEAVEQDVERARGDVYAVVNTLTALNAAVQSAGGPARARRGVGAALRAGVARAGRRARAGARWSGSRPPSSSAAPRTASRPRASPGPRASRSWRAPASSTSGGPVMCAHASRSWRDSRPGSARSRSWTRTAPASPMPPAWCW